MAKAKKSTLGFVCLALVAICAILAIVGVTQDWTVVKLGGETMKGSTLADYKEAADLADQLGSEDNVSKVIMALGYLSVAAICVVAVAYIIKQLISITLFRIIVILAGVVTMAIGVAAIAYTASQVSGLSTETTDGFLSGLLEGITGGETGVNLGIGCYLTSIGASAGGLFAAVGCFKR